MPSEAELLRDPLGAVVVGPDLFASALIAQGVPVRRVDWRPPSASGDLASLWCDAVDAANRVTLDRILAAHQVLVDVRPAIEVVPGMTRDTVLHAGPPIAWERMSGPMRGGDRRRADLRRAGDDVAGRGAARHRRRRSLRPLPPSRDRRTDGRRHDRLDAGARGREPDRREPRLFHDQRGARQGAALRRLRGGRDRSTALDPGRARPGASAKRSGERAAST